LIETVLNDYSIGTSRSCQIYKRGLNDTYLVTTEQEKYILRVYRCGWRTKEEIDFEQNCWRFCMNKGIRQLDAAAIASIPIFVKVAHIWVMGISTSVVGMFCLMGGLLTSLLHAWKH
jgi:hypothetical protein